MQLTLEYYSDYEKQRIPNFRYEGNNFNPRQICYFRLYTVLLEYTVYSLYTVVSYCDQIQLCVSNLFTCFRLILHYTEQFACEITLYLNCLGKLPNGNEP